MVPCMNQQKNLVKFMVLVWIVEANRVGRVGVFFKSLSICALSLMVIILNDCLQNHYAVTIIYF